tara:strand:+ start:1204 stop:1422 length:219 start_codon:yes stop_codon:yes gene_type:complete
MCPPKAPKPLPPPRPTAPAPEKTTKAVVSGTRKKKANMPGSGLKGRRSDLGGTASLRLGRLDTGKDPNLNIS